MVRNAQRQGLTIRRWDQCRYLGSRIVERSRARLALLRPPSPRLLSLATAGFNGNLGDRALHVGTAATLRHQGVVTRGICYSQAHRWSCGERGLVMAGGEIGDNEHFRQLMAMQPDPQRCAVLGIGPTNAFLQNPDPDVLRYLSRLPLLAVRHGSGRRLLQQLVQDAAPAAGHGDREVVSMPDLVFASYQRPRALADQHHSERCIGINMLPLYLNLTRSGRFVLAEDLVPLLALSSPELDPEAAAQGYVRTMRRLLKRWRSQGYRILHCPFSPADAAFAALVDPEAAPVSLWHSTCFNAMLRRIARCELFVATRFHAHVAALIAGTPLISFALAGKTMNLLQDLALPPGLNRNLLQHGGLGPDQVCQAPRLLLPPTRLEALALQAQSMLRAAAAVVS